MKNIIAFVLSLMIIIGCVPVYAAEEEPVNLSEYDCVLEGELAGCTVVYKAPEKFLDSLYCNQFEKDGSFVWFYCNCDTIPFYLIKDNKIYTLKEAYGDILDHSTISKIAGLINNNEDKLKGFNMGPINVAWGATPDEGLVSDPTGISPVESAREKINPELREKIAENENSLIPIQILLKDDYNKSEVEKYVYENYEGTDKDSKLFKKYYREEVKKIISSRVQKFVDDYKLLLENIRYQGEYYPLVIADVYAYNIEEIAQYNSVTQISYYDDTPGQPESEAALPPSGEDETIKPGPRPPRPTQEGNLPPTTDSKEPKVYNSGSSSSAKKSSSKPKLNIKTATLKCGKKLTLSVKNRKGKKVSFSSSLKSVAKVSKKGVVTTLKRGRAVISVKVGKSKLKCVVKVTSNPRLSKTNITVKKGKSVTVKIIGKAKGVNNKYKNSKRAKVASKKSASKIKIKGKKRGKSTLRIIVNGVTLKMKVRVK